MRWPLTGMLLLLATPALAQIEPLTTQQLQQQNQATIQGSAQSLQQSMTQTTLGQIDQREREQQLFNTVPGQVPGSAPPVVVVTPPAIYVMPPPPAPPPPP